MSFWSKERVAELVTRWNSDESASQIADLWGLTRSAIVGKVFRLRKKGVQLRAEHDLDQRRRVSLQHVRQKAAKAAARGATRRPVKQSFPRETLLAQLMAEAKAAPPLKPDPADVPKKTLLELEDNECKYACGSSVTGEHMFCADKSVPGLPYCANHVRKCYVPLPPSTGRGFKLPPLIRVRESV